MKAALLDYLRHFLACTDKKENKIFLIYKEIQTGAVVKSYMTDDLLLKVHKIENFFDSDFGICVISLIVMSKY